jgi:signal peptidase I
MPGRPAFAALAIVCGLCLCWAGGATAQSPPPSGQDVARSVIAGDLRPLLDPASATRFGVVEIATEAMTPTLAVNDRVLYDRAAYATASPGRGEVIIFRPPPSAVRTCGGDGLFVMRVVGTEGDVVRTTGRGVIVNGSPQTVTGLRPPASVQRFPAVPGGSVLVFGDNGPGSCGSNQWRNPFVPTSYIVGRVDGVVWPRDRAGLLPAGGGVDRLNPAGVERDRLDASIAVGHGYDRIVEALTSLRICSIITPRDCDVAARLDAAAAIRDERRTLRPFLPSLGAECAGEPIRVLRRALGKDHRAVLDRRVGLRRLALRLRVHHAVAVEALAACWAAPVR